MIKKQDEILALFLDQTKLEATSVNTFVNFLTFWFSKLQQKK